ncbi:hypothetical protein FLJC2902T_22620 [Flavobacterium limnosediminis JC2902]|uniref:HNH nuclease domain-containing protein n=1 Tax=Flavobacterium limnosediminis JC2902 TaxID=1341181 RepID=V6SKW0_9FLAO|nr:hypothetical protein [Flavobacterium limnosediminis]ESU27084.1 hypothetical protein FLJC2902T_22620 [Flavobacterium limnosediminis JC2902]
MKKIKKPEIKVKQVFTDCISIVRNPIYKQQLTNCIDTLEAAETDLENKITGNTVHEIAQNEVILGTIVKEDMEKVYNDRMSKKGTPARDHYNTIFLSAPNGKCPFCSQRIVKTLDHYLPKSKYPIFAVTPINLIPCCSDCNKDKLVDYPTSQEEETLHPYFDDVENEVWLKAKLLQTNPIGFEYYVFPSPNRADLLNRRILNHFNSFGLNKLYSVHAIEELENNKQHFKKLFANGGYDLLRAHLKDGFDSRSSVNLNSWQTAFYCALYEDEWFCNGGVMI